MDGDKEFDGWLKSSVESCAKPMEESTIFASIVTKNYMKNPLCALQLGLAILMNKPIILIVDKNEKIPESLVKIAKVIEYVDTENPADMRRASESIAKLAEQLDEEKSWR